MLSFSSAVFGSYLRPDLVPANHAYHDGSSVGTVSNYSVFVNVDNQTEDRYDLGSSLLRFGARHARGKSVSMRCAQHKHTQIRARASVTVGRA